jgi:hypothetical protein
MAPLYSAVNQSGGGQILNSDLLSSVSAALDYSQANHSDIIWLSKYGSYAENDFSANGIVTVNSSVTGSNFVPINIKAESLVLDSHILQNFSNFTIYNITVQGRANLLIRSSNLVSAGTAVIPNYFLIEVSDCSINLKSIDDGLLRINTDKGTFIAKEVDFRSNNTSLIVERPCIDVNGSVLFRKISMPANASPWSTDVELLGETKFHIAYGDSNYVFFDQFSFPAWKSSAIQAPSLPLNDILVSPFSIGLLVLFCVSYFVAKRGFFRLSVSDL